MDLTTCSVCVIAGSAGGAVGGFLASSGRSRSRGRRAPRGGRAMRSWPGARRDEPRPLGAPAPRHRRGRSDHGPGRPVAPGHDEDGREGEEATGDGEGGDVDEGGGQDDRGSG